MTEVKSGPVALVIPGLGGGGAARTWLNLAEGLLDRGHAVDLIVLVLRGEYKSVVPAGVTVFGSSRWSNNSQLYQFFHDHRQFHNLRVGPVATTVAWHRYRREWPDTIRRLCSWKLVRDAEIVRAYLERRNPRALVAALPRACCATIMGKEQSRSNAMVIAGIRNNVLKGYRAEDNERARFLFPKADMVVGVSRGAVDDAAQHLNLPANRIHYIYNGVQVDQIDELCNTDGGATTPDFPFEEPVILNAARFNHGKHSQKDQITLIRAFATVRKSMPAKLVFIGPGQRKELVRKEFLALATELGVKDDIVFWGFYENPYRYMKAAAVLVVSSRWEGFPNVLLEAMACGTPVVSTDTPFGPAEILDHGRFGPLVPVGDEHSMAVAITEVLTGNRLSSEALRARAEEFPVSRMVSEYEQLIACAGRVEGTGEQP